jgi:hypothetical protein
MGQDEITLPGEAAATVGIGEPAGQVGIFCHGVPTFQGVMRLLSQEDSDERMKMNAHEKLVELLAKDKDDSGLTWQEWEDHMRTVLARAVEETGQED